MLDQENGLLRLGGDALMSFMIFPPSPHPTPKWAHPGANGHSVARSRARRPASARRWTIHGQLVRLIPETDKLQIMDGLFIILFFIDATRLDLRTKEPVFPQPGSENPP